MLKKMLSLAAVAMLSAGAWAADPAETKVVEEKLGSTLIKMEMVRVPGGTVEVKVPGGETKTVEVKPFWIAKTELTWDQYDLWHLGMDLPDPSKVEEERDKTRPSPPYGAPDHGWGHQGYPALHIAHDAAQMYCDWLSKHTGKKYRLPTEAEWEWAARAGGSDAKLEEEKLKGVAWYADNSANDVGEACAHAVGKKEPNAWGLYDMFGNVAEWVVGIDGQKVVKGGHYESSAAAVHSRARLPYKKSWQERDPQDPKSEWWLSDGPWVGFRVVREE